MSQIRILRVIARMNVGGPALQVSGLADGLDPGRFEQRLLVGAVDPDEADYLTLRAPQVEATRVPGLGRSPNPTSDLRALAALVREIRRFRPHIVHTHTAKAGVLGRTAAILARCPCRVHTFHGHLLHGYFSPRVTRAVVLTERAFARRTTRLVAVGRQVRDDLLAAGIGRENQYLVVPPGVQLPRAPTRRAARQDLDLPPGAPVVAFVARLTHIKRPDRFGEVALQLAAQRPDMMFIVAGEGDGLPDLRAQLNPLGSQVRFLGWRSDMERIYAAADVALLTSDNEGMPVSLIEAASVGCPAVSTRVGSVAEVVRDGESGFVVDAAVDPLATAVLRIVDDADLRDRFGAAAARWAHEHFSRDRLVSDTAHLYEDLVGTTVAR